FLFKSKYFMKILSSFDAVIARVPGQYAQNAARCALYINKPLGLEVVGCPFDSYWNYGSVEGKIVAPIMHFNMKRVVSDAGHVVYVTQKFLQRRYPCSGKTLGISNVDVHVNEDEQVPHRI